MNIFIIIIEILWFAIAMMLCFEHIEILASIPRSSAFIAMIIFFIGAPFFLIVNVLEMMLNCIFPENWDDDNDDNFRIY